MTRKLLGAMAMVCALGVPMAAHAGLGGPVDSFSASPSHMMVRMHAVAPVGAGARHTMSLANGGEVREYADASGMVYAVRWMGPGKPDLETLLGRHFATFQADNPAGARHGLRRPPRVDRPEVKIVTGGHPGAFWGYAWLPQAVPSGFDPAAL